MAIINLQKIAFANAQVQTQVRISFNIRFRDFELSGNAPPSWHKNFPALFQAVLPLTSVSYRVLVKLNVIRVVPRPFVAGAPPPSLPDPVAINSKALPVPVPVIGKSSTSMNVTMNFELGTNSNLIYDHLHGEIVLFRSINEQGMAFNQRLDTKVTNDLVITVSDLANPQSNGIHIP